MDPRRRASRRLRAAAVQLAAGRDWRKNLKESLRWAKRALRRRVHLLAFPEHFLLRGDHGDYEKFIQEEGPQTALREFSAFARRSGAACLLGSMVEASKVRGKYYNTSYLLDARGRKIASYRKIHLFDAGLPSVSVQESRHFLRGRTPALASLKGIPAGLTICYDLRFPELFRRLSARGARVIFLPANFTFKTGEAHWEVLVRARAIENQVFIIAPAQTGTSPSTGIPSFGTSLIVDPWGTVLAKGGIKKEGILTADLDLGFQERLRRELPALLHRRLT